MKRRAITIAAAVAVALAAIGAGQAFATSSHTTAPTTLRVVMRDPGCHWFAVGGKFTTTATVAGPVRLLNLDEATLKAASVGTAKRIPVGRSIVLGRGHYVITMVGQAPDDNHLKLVVR
jgi:hypothetical protein